MSSMTSPMGAFGGTENTSDHDLADVDYSRVDSGQCLREQQVALGNHSNDSFSVEHRQMADMAILHDSVRGRE